MRPTFEEVNLISLPRPHVHKGIDAISRDSTPANLQRHRVTVSSAVVPVLVQPVPAIPHEVGVEADDHLAIGRLLLADPVEHGAESPFAASLWWPEQTQLYKENKNSQIKLILCHRALIVLYRLLNPGRVFVASCCSKGLGWFPPDCKKHFCCNLALYKQRFASCFL